MLGGDHAAFVPPPNYADKKIIFFGATSSGTDLGGRYEPVQVVPETGRLEAKA